MTSYSCLLRSLSRAYSLPPDVPLAGEKIKVPSTALSDEDKAALEEEIANFKSEDDDAKTTTTYVPLFLDDKVAHGHYDGYCKQSEIFIVFLQYHQFFAFLYDLFSSTLAALPLSSLARRFTQLPIRVLFGG